MTIEAWNIVLSAIILVVITSGGLWLKYVVDQQLKSKDSAIQALEAIVKMKDATISSLERNTAPAITSAYAQMRNHANEMTAEYQKMSEQLEEAMTNQLVSKTALPGLIAFSRCDALSLALTILDKRLGNVLLPNGEPPSKDDLTAEGASRNKYEAFRQAQDEIKTCFVAYFKDAARVLSSRTVH